MLTIGRMGDGSLSHRVRLVLLLALSPAWSQAPARGADPPSQSAQTTPQPSEPPPKPGESTTQPSQTTAQPSQAPPQPAPAAQPPPGLPTAEEIQAKASQIETREGVPDAVRTEAGALYRQAVEQLTAARSWATKVKDFRVGREQAPALLAAAQDRLHTLRNPPAAPETTVKPGATLEELAQALAEAETALKNNQDAVRNIENESGLRSERRSALPELLTSANTRLAAADRGVADAKNASATPIVQEARQTLAAAQRYAVSQEIGAYNEELAFYEARQDLIAVRLDEARLGLRHAEARAAALRETVGKKRSLDAAEQQRKAKEDLERTPQVVRDVAAGNEALARERTEVAGRIKRAEQELQSAGALSDRLRSDFGKIKAYAEQSDMQDLLGSLMRVQRDQLLGLQRYERAHAVTRDEFSRVQVRIADLESDRVELLDLDAAVAAQMAALTDGVRTESLAPQVRSLLEQRRPGLDDLKRDYEVYATDLIELASALSTLVARVDQTQSFLDERALWTRSTSPIHRMRIPDDARAVGRDGRRVIDALSADVRVNRPIYGALAFAVVVMLVLNVRVRRDLRRIRDRVLKPRTDRYALTVMALLYTAVMAAPGPFILYALAWRMRELTPGLNDSQFAVAAALGYGLLKAGALLFVAEFARLTCLHYGLGVRHFQWHADGMKSARRNIAGIELLVVPLSLLLMSTEAYAGAPWRDSVGRSAFCVAVIAAAVFSVRLLTPHSALIRIIARRRATWARRASWFGVLGTVGLALLLLGLSCWGYHYTAIELAQRLCRTIGLAFAVLIAHALLFRWITYAQRRLAIAEAEQKRSNPPGGGFEGGGAPAESAAESPELKIRAIGEQTRRLLRSFAVIGLVIAVWVSWAQLLPALRILNNVTLWSYAAETVVRDTDTGVARTMTTIQYITLANAALCAVVVLGTYVIARNIPGLLEIVVLRSLPLDAGARFAITAISRYAIVVIGVLVAFSAIGVGWAKVQWLVAAITVGLGFGLQEIFGNFVSGLIILFERPIRIGDTISIGEARGTVTRIRIRATTITDWDRKELVIPNKEFVTGQVVNWSLSDQVVRLIIKVGIAYGSDVQRAKRILLETARNSNYVLPDPQPRALFCSFGESALEFELRVFVRDIDEWIHACDSLHCEIDEAFRRAGIEIAFPQRDIHVRSIRAALPVDDGRRSAPGDPTAAADRAET